MAEVRDIEHILIAGDRELLCLWPRYGGLWRWGREILVAYIESPCRYRHPQEATPDLGGAWKRAYIRLRRSFDGGLRWEDAGKPFEHSLPFEKQRRILRLDEYRLHAGPTHAQLDMAAADAVLLMGRSWCGEEIPDMKARAPVTFVLRSADRGLQWDPTPAILWPERTTMLVEMANNTLRVGKRTFAWVAGTMGRWNDRGSEQYAALLYASEDDGATWEFFGEICADVSGRTSYSFPQLVVLPSGRWLSVLGAWDVAAGERLSWTAMCVSDDGGLTWSPPRKIQVWTHAPFALRLKDGRILVVYTRCAPDPTGLYAIWSEDNGGRWSEPVCLRGDFLAAGPRGIVPGAYPVAVEMEDGRILVVYCWQHDEEDVPWYGGRSFIAGTFFRLA